MVLMNFPETQILPNSCLVPSHHILKSMQKKRKREKKKTLSQCTMWTILQTPNLKKFTASFVSEEVPQDPSG
jgi:hypothetical protein